MSSPRSARLPSLLLRALTGLALGAATLAVATSPAHAEPASSSYGKPRPTKMWQHPDRHREKVRRVIAGAARSHGVDPQLALAIAWQESGWRMGVMSEAHAIGAMQVLPSTGRWMEQYAGRDLRLRKLGDNATAGVLLLDVLSRHTHRRSHKIGAYYQGLGAVREHGLYRETRRYVANVEAIKRRLEAGRPPA